MVSFWQFGLLGIVMIAMVTDLRNRKIYNWLTFPAMAAGLVLSVVTGGFTGLESSLLGFFAGVAIFAVGFFLNAMGAGDVKLMGVVGLWLGWPSTLAAVVYVALMGGLIAIAAALANGSLLQLLKNVKNMALALATPGAKAEGAFTHSAAAPIPYGVSIALGTALALFFPRVSEILHLAGLS
jgi:prepilin peptidase CpaA